MSVTIERAWPFLTMPLETMVIADHIPVKPIGVESRWMILAAVDKKGIYLVIPDKGSKPSIIIR